MQTASHGAAMFSRACILVVALSFIGHGRAADDPVRANVRLAPGAMAGRQSNETRAAAMAKFGGKDQSERAVLRGLRWLKQHQNEDGSWSTEYRPSMTGFALLCFLGHGELADSPEFGLTVQKGLDWLLTKGAEANGRMSFSPETEGWGGGNAGVYEHAIATFAIAEYYAMSKDARFSDLIRKAVTHIVQGQALDGGWQYGYSKGPGSDTSVSGWQIQALKAAHLTGLSIPGVEDALDKAMGNLKRVQAESGNFGYRMAGDRAHPSLVGVGVFCIYSWKQDRDRGVRDGIEFMLNMTDKYPVKYKSESADLYAWYYDTQACHSFGGSAWQKWNRLFQDEICQNQSPDGSWPPTISKAPGGEFQRKPDGAGPIYRTALCTLMLESFYRYMPPNL